MAISTLSEHSPGMKERAERALAKARGGEPKKQKASTKRSGSKNASTKSGKKAVLGWIRRK